MEMPRPVVQKRDGNGDRRQRRARVPDPGFQDAEHQADQQQHAQGQDALRLLHKEGIYDLRVVRKGESSLDRPLTLMLLQEAAGIPGAASRPSPTSSSWPAWRSVSSTTRPARPGRPPQPGQGPPFIPLRCGTPPWGQVLRSPLEFRLRVESISVRPSPANPECRGLSGGNLEWPGACFAVDKFCG